MDFGSVLIFLGIITLSGLFSGTETAITAVSNVSLVRFADAGSKPARILQKMLQQKGRVIAALLVANNIVNVILAVYATVVFDGFIQDGNLLPPWAAPIVASICSVTFLLVFGEVVPKSIAVTFRTQWALASAYFVFGLMLATMPVTWLLIKFSDGIMRLMGKRPGEDDIFDLHEIHTVAHLGEQMGVIDSMEKGLIQRAAHLNDTRVREIMIPRTDIQGLDANTPLDDIRALFQKTPYSRIPVYQGDLDDIVGILNFKEFLRHDPSRARGFDLMAFLHKPLFVPESMFIGDLLSEMRSKRTHLAIVLDEYGGTAGLLSLEDVVEMLVGRIEDEYDVLNTPFEQVDANTWEVDGRVTDERLVTRLGLKLPPEALEGFDTVAGLTLKAFGNIPSEGDTATYHGIEITATRVKGHRVRRAKIKVLTPEEIEAIQTSAGGSARRRPTRPIRPELEQAAKQVASDGVTPASNESAGNTGEETVRKHMDQPELVAPEVAKTDAKTAEKQE
ncbi:MAG: HlyC/CorC family transporter [Planctomycetes bacterium]|nr:HlyC/CorC family transporter [Planctomycetota bacterium]